MIVFAGHAKIARLQKLVDELTPPFQEASIAIEIDIAHRAEIARLERKIADMSADNNLRSLGKQFKELVRQVTQMP